MKGIVGKALTTGIAVAALSAGATVLAAPAQADGGDFECYTKINSGKGKGNCADGAGDGALLRGNFAVKYQCAGSSRWTKTGFHVADGSHPIYVECAPASGVTEMRVIPDPVPTP